MVFRKIYWVTEQLSNDGSSAVTGVYTSIPDLVERGLRMHDWCNKTDGFRVSLHKLDCNTGALGTWTSPDYSNLESEIQQFVETKEFSTGDVESLSQAIRAL